MANPGPASSSFPVYQPVNSGQALVLLAVYKGLSLSAAGDFVMTTVGSINNFVATTVLTTNSAGVVNVSSGTVGIYTLPAQGGTAVLTTAALTGQTTNAFAYVRAATSAAAQVILGSEAPLYVNIGTAVAGATIDLYLYGYNVT
jgi:hypothetical protein